MNNIERLKLKPKLKPSNNTFYKYILFLSIAFLIIGNRIATRGEFLPNKSGSSVYSVVVTEIIEREVTSDYLNSDIWDAFITFRSKIIRGPLKGMDVIGEQTLSSRWLLMEKEVEVGDRVLLGKSEFNNRYFFVNYIRINYILILSAVFMVIIVLLGKKEGINSIIALSFTCIAVFFVFIPAILSGRNIYATTIIVCIFSIVSTPLMVIGPNKKAFSTILGCLGGVLLAGFLMFVMDGILNLTGFIDEDTRYLKILPTVNPIDINAIIFAGVTIGSVGAIMDVSMSISSSLWELKALGKTTQFGVILKAGNNIGKDILGTMLNTLILAYIGSSLSSILLIVAHTNSYVALFNSEMVIVEFLRALTGGFGMLLTIPLTTVICAFMYKS